MTINLEQVCNELLRLESEIQDAKRRADRAHHEALEAFTGLTLAGKRAASLKRIIGNAINAKNGPARPE